jgi:catechol 2,3-dioxygenase-like lactoylglutathione lyase family enzyme
VENKINLPFYGIELMQLNLTLGVADLKKSEKFYREILLFSPEFFRNSNAEKAYFMLSCGGTNIVFQQLHDMELQHPALLQNLTRTPLGAGVQLELSCANLDDIYRKIKHYCWPIAYELEDQEYRRRELWLHDPDGYLLVLNEE